MLASIVAPAPSHLPTSLPRAHLPAALTVPLRASPGAAPVSYPMHARHRARCRRERGRGARRGAFHLSRTRGRAGRAPREATAPAALHARGFLPDRARDAPRPPADASSSRAFAILHVFMHTHRLAPVLAALLPLPLPLPSSRPLLTLAHRTGKSSPTQPSSRALASHLCASSSNFLSALMGHACHVKELWQDMIPSCGTRSIWREAVGGVEFGSAVGRGVMRTAASDGERPDDAIFNQRPTRA
ncbi:hypothetical protein DFH09DRAFT_1473745 [Mycena vulgaris]|nr:hypothetical protein DFH09DRAFT_1473745 [Mycena vulgaris]